VSPALFVAAGNMAIILPDQWRPKGQMMSLSEIAPRDSHFGRNCDTIAVNG
jgi:hypothetical protein